MFMKGKKMISGAKKKALLIAAIAIPAITAFVYMLVFETITPSEKTNTVLLITMARIYEYDKDEGELPSELKGLPPRSGYMNSIKDGWGNKLIYFIGLGKSVHLLSYGHDGRKGGGDDMGIQFDLANERGLEPIETVKPTSFIEIKLEAIQKQILKFRTTNGRLPENLKAINLDEPFFDNTTQDLWGNEIVYEKRNGEVVLKSYGKDGKLNGNEDNADITLCFTVSQKNE